MFHYELRKNTFEKFIYDSKVVKGKSCSVQFSLKKRRFKSQTGDEHLHGSLLMNCGPGLCWEGGGLGVPTSLFLAIFVLALANSSRRVWGISGSNRTPYDQQGKKKLATALIHENILLLRPEQNRK